MILYDKIVGSSQNSSGKVAGLAAPVQIEEPVPYCPPDVPWWKIWDPNWNISCLFPQKQATPTTLSPTQTPLPSGTKTYIPTSPVVPSQVTATAGNTIELGPPLTVNKSSIPGVAGSYGGVEVEQFYDLLKSDKKGWWYALGDFTFEDFNGLLLQHESSGKPLVAYGLEQLSFENIVKLKMDFEPKPYGSLNAIVAAQQLYVGGWNPPYCPSGKACTNGAYNFWAAYSQSAQRQIDLFVRGDKPVDGVNQGYSGYFGAFGNPGATPTHTVEDIMMEARALGHAMLYPENLNMDRWNALSQCGNTPDQVNFLLQLSGNDPAFADLHQGVFYPSGYKDTGLYFFTTDGNGIWSSVDFWRYHLSQMGYATPTATPKP